MSVLFLSWQVVQSDGHVNRLNSPSPSSSNVNQMDSLSVIQSVSQSVSQLFSQSVSQLVKETMKSDNP